MGLARQNTRIVVIGSSCSGKSTVSKALSVKIGIEHIELDALYWLPNWQKRPTAEFQTLVKQKTQGSAWVVDGNYSVAQSIFLPKATLIIWLNHSFGRVLYRSVKRSISRVITQEKLFAGNVESLRQTFFSRDSIILWVLKSFYRKRKMYCHLLAGQRANGIQVVELCNQREVDNYLGTIES